MNTMKNNSVQETGFWCTEWKFGAKNSLLVYATHLQCANSFQYNAMDLVTNICSGASTSVNYSYLWNGAKTNLL